MSAGVPALFATSPAVTSEPLVSVLVHAPLAQVQALAPGTPVVEAYDSFVIVKATADQAAAFEAHGIAVDPQDSGYWIGLGSYEFDVRQGEPAVPAELQDPVTAGVDLYLVHFIGPVKTEWLGQLRDAGAQLLQSLPTYAFLVSMDASVRDAVQNLRFVDWVGVYQPAFKVQPALAGVQGTTAVEILTVNAADTDAVVAALADHGLGFIPFSSAATGILSTYSTGDLGVVRARLDASLIPEIARMRNVLVVEPWSQPQIMDYDAQAVLQTGLAPSAPGARRLWDSGIKGDGQIIALGDTGIDFDLNYFRENATYIQKGEPGDTTGTIGPLSIYNTTDLSRRKLVRYIPMSGYRGIDPWTGGDVWATRDSFNAGGCPSGHGTSTSANAGGWDPNNPTSIGNGMAPDAKLIIEDIGTIGITTQCPTAPGGDALSYIPDNYANYFQPAYDNGSRIFSNSWGGTDNGYDIGAMMVDRFIWNHPDMAIFFASGNGGPNRFTVTSPGTAKDIVTIGGANPYPGQESVTGQSSRGPTADGRLKPDTTTFFAGYTASSDGNPTDNAANTNTTFFGGTSHATPLAAGMAALVRQYFEQGYYPTGTAIANNSFDPSAALVKAMMTAGSRRMTGATSNQTPENTYPNDAQGWGRLTLDDALYVNPATEGQRKTWVVDQMTNGLSTGQSVDYKIKVNSSVVPLRIVMAYSDYPALPGSNPALVNDLNLQVTSPTGAVYKGNVFSIFVQGQSLPNTGSFDNKNPIEGVIVTSPAAGEWTIHIEGANVPAGPQGYAVVAIGDLDMGYGDLRLDKTTYSESDTIHITVQDWNAPSVTVALTSSFETTAENVTLTQTAPGSGVWKGSIPTAFRDPAPDGILEVSEGGAIQAVYHDVNPAHDAIVTATVLASPPAISNVRAEGITNAAATIKWSTNKPADSVVYYGTTPTSLPFTARDTAYVTTHSVDLVGLQTNTLYYYDVQSGDTLGHSTRDTNGGIHYSFRTTFLGDVLLVIGDTTFTSDRIAEYRDALAASAWPWNEWYVANSGDPPLAVLQQYKVVLWQPGLEEYPAVTDTQRPLLRSYIDGGGRLYINGQDIGWGMCSAPGGPVTASQYYTVQRCQWYKDITKALFKQDPQTFTQIVGIAADPISGPYVTGITYVGHRTGGYGDEISNLCQTGGTCVRAGATSSYDWRDFGGVATPDFVALKWISDAANGTAGVGVWGGAVSKVVYAGYEWTDINWQSGVPSNAARTDILNRTIIWLLDGRYHPSVHVASPNGGEVLTTSPATITWSRTTSGGTNVGTQTLYYSNDSGQSWNVIGTALPTDTSYSWDISALPNGAHYRVRVDVQDDGAPALTGLDTSDNDFTINRVGGDTLGPLIWPGSITVVPNPIVRNALTTFTATADDTRRGNSNIAAAEFFQGAAPGADGTGTPMNASDGAYNSPVESITFSSAAIWAAGTDCFWVHAKDAVNNWGPFEERCIVVVNTSGRDITPPALTSFSGTALSGATFGDVRLTWARAPDEGTLGGTVLYRVFRSTTIAGPYAKVGPDISAGTYTYTDVGAGDRAASMTYFYFVQTVDAAGNVANGTDRAGKASRDLPAGTSLVSSPFRLADTSVATIFQTVMPNLRSAWTYVASTQTWLTWSSGRPAGQNSLATIGPTQAFYVNLTAADQITLAGLIPATTSIPLSVGWNLVAFPSWRTTITASSITGATMVLAFDPARPGQTRIMAGTETLQAGQAYWIKVGPLPVTWVVPGL